jgi:hypothetical protein
MGPANSFLKRTSGLAPDASWFVKQRLRVFLSLFLFQQPEDQMVLVDPKNEAMSVCQE